MQTNKYTHKRTTELTNKQTNKQTYKQTNKQANEQTNGRAATGHQLQGTEGQALAARFSNPGRYKDAL
jgi:hypothetical protein